MHDTQGNSKDDGFGIVELLVAMTIMALILMAIAPFLVSAFKATSRSVRMAGATEIVNTRISTANEHAGNCNDLVTYLATASELVTDRNRNMEFQVAQASQLLMSDNSRVSVTLEDCQAELDELGTALVYYHVDVYDPSTLGSTADAKVLATGRTWIVVK